MRSTEKQKLWRQAHPNYMQEWREKHPGYSEEKAKANQERAQTQAYIIGELTKDVVLTHYGGGKLACVKCGFSNIKALSLDHINGGAYRERKQQKREHKAILTGKALYRHLYLREFPVGYQTLCMNCQFIKRNENNEYRKRR